MKNKKIEVKQEGVKIIVDFTTVWSFMWRWVVIVLALYVALFFLGFLFGIVFY